MPSVPLVKRRNSGYRAKKRKKGSRFVSVRIRFYTKLLFNISFIRDATKTSESNHHQWRFDLQLWRVCCGDELTGNQTNGWINGWTKEGGNELLHRKRIINKNEM